MLTPNQSTSFTGGLAQGSTKTNTLTGPSSNGTTTPSNNKVYSDGSANNLMQPPSPYHNSTLTKTRPISSIKQNLIQASNPEATGQQWRGGYNADPYSNKGAPFVPPGGKENTGRWGWLDSVTDFAEKALPYAEMAAALL